MYDFRDYVVTSMSSCWSEEDYVRIRAMLLKYGVDRFAVKYERIVMLSQTS